MPYSKLLAWQPLVVPHRLCEGVSVKSFWWQWQQGSAGQRHSGRRH